MAGSLDKQWRRTHPFQKQARIEAFADTQLERSYDDQDLFFQYSAQLSGLTNLDAIPEDFPEELKDAIKRNKQEYLHFLREEKKRGVQFNEENVRQYKGKFRDKITELRQRIDEGTARADFLGSGSNGDAYALMIDDEKYAVKFNRNVSQSHFDIKPLLRAQGIPHTAQLVSYSLPDHVVVMELLPGKPATEITHQEVQQYSDQEMLQLIETVEALYGRGIGIDPKPSNFLFDPQKGFSILDFHFQQGKRTLAEDVMNLIGVLAIRKTEKKDSSTSSLNDEESRNNALRDTKVLYQTMLHFFRVLQQNRPAIIEEWKKHVAEVKEDPSQYSSRAFVNREYLEKSHFGDDPEILSSIQGLEALGEDWIFE